MLKNNTAIKIIVSIADFENSINRYWTPDV